MNSVMGGLGIMLFWLSWPAQYLYFALFPERTRVLVVADGEFLVVRPRLGTGAYMLPGGGQKRHESLLQSAVRELREETGIEIPETSLKLLGRRQYKENGIRYRATHYTLQLPEKPPLSPEGHEILDVRWLSVDQPSGLLMDEVLYAIKHFKPLKQTELL